MMQFQDIVKQLIHTMELRYRWFEYELPTKGLIRSSNTRVPPLSGKEKMVGHEPLPTANIDTPYLFVVNCLKKICPWIVTALYPIKKLIDFLRVDSLCYTVNLKQFLRVLSYTKGYRTDTISIYAYFLSQTLYKQYYGNTCRFIKQQLNKPVNV